jgi:hypothetical protein
MCQPVFKNFGTDYLIARLGRKVPVHGSAVIDPVTTFILNAVGLYSNCRSLSMS